jgi:hypothetical protein
LAGNFAETGAERDVNVSAEDFVRAWQTSSSVAEAAAKIGFTGPTAKSHASWRAVRLRREGIPLKKMRSGRIKLNIGDLKRLAIELGGNGKVDGAA